MEILSAQMLCFAKWRALHAVILLFVLFCTQDAEGEPVSKETKVLGLAKRVFQDLGKNHGDTHNTASIHQSEFDALDSSEQALLAGLFKLRVLDLQTTLNHTLAMQEVIAAMRV